MEMGNLATGNRFRGVVIDSRRILEADQALVFFFRNFTLLFFGIGVCSVRVRRYFRNIRKRNQVSYGHCGVLDEMYKRMRRI